MRTHKHLLAISALLLTQSCQPTQHQKAITLQYSQPIPIDTANRMITSYLTSVNYPANNTYLRSLLFSADTLRLYLADSRIVHIQFKLAHQLGWINSGKYGVNGNTKADALSMIIVGLDADGHYIYPRAGVVYEHMQPCPYHCDPITPVILTR